jgi:hemolysin activation/secretion protein
LGRRYDLIGDIKLEWNVEYRLRVYKLFETAFFLDAGNVWLRKPDPSLLNGEFRFNRFYKEIALGAGVGLRLNFDYFIVRLDAAHPLHDPSFMPGDRWAFDQLMLSRLNFNLGIAYPF